MHHDISRAHECARIKSMKNDLFHGFLTNCVLGITPEQTAVITIGQNIKKAETPEHIQHSHSKAGAGGETPNTTPPWEHDRV